MLYEEEREMKYPVCYNHKEKRWMITDHTVIPTAEKALPFGTSEAQVRVLVGVATLKDYIQAWRDDQEWKALRRFLWKVSPDTPWLQERQLSIDWSSIR